jgi:hypothetical protein
LEAIAGLGEQQSGAPAHAESATYDQRVLLAQAKEIRGVYHR